MSLAKGKQNKSKYHKTEIIIYGSRKKQITKHLNFRISGQKINTCSNVKYLGITLQKNLEWNLHLNLLESKLNRATDLLCKIRQYEPKFLLKTLHYTIFHFHLIYACQIWGQSFNTLTKIQPLQDKALRVINFKANNHDVRDLYKNDQILKTSDYIKVLSCLFVRDVLTKSTISPFQNYFNKSENLYHHNTTHAKQNSVILTQRRTAFYDIDSIQHQSALAWNRLQKETNHNLL